MTPSKIWYAQKLATLRNDGSKPEELAEQMTIRKLCYEIEKIEEEQMHVEEALANQEKVKKTKPKSFWARIALDSSSEEEEDS